MEKVSQDNSLLLADQYMVKIAPNYENLAAKLCQKKGYLCAKHWLNKIYMNGNIDEDTFYIINRMLLNITKIGG